jgi:outer membrane receptor for ferric coprogen and ferric-rhodotorulic acid
MHDRILPRPGTLATLLALTFAAAAQAEQKHPHSLPTINVNASAESDGYLVRAVSTATETDTALADLPQAVTVIGEALMRDQSMQSMADVVRYVPGIGMANGKAIAMRLCSAAAPARRATSIWTACATTSSITAICTTWSRSMR